MTRLDDALIDQLAHQETPRAYSHEVKAMAQEIFEWRQKAAEAAKAAQTQQGTSSIPNLQPGLPYPGGLYP
jgi:hypothetical protein